MAATVMAELGSLIPDLQRIFGQSLDRMSWDTSFRAISILLAASTKKNFDLGQSPDGIPWLPLKHPRPRSAGMGKANAAKGERDRPLRDTGLLAASLTASGSHHIERIDRSVFEWGTNLEYAWYHQWGTRKIPQRQFLGLNQDLLEQIGQVVLEQAVEQIGKKP